MSNNESFQAEIVAGIETPGSQEAAKVFAKLLDLVEKLEGSAKSSGEALVEAFQAGKKPEELASKIRVLQRELKFLGTVGKGADLFRSEQVSQANAITRAINDAARAYDAMRQNQSLARYELGLESKTTLEAANSMKVLEKNLKAVDLALQGDSGNKALQEKKKLLSDNKALLDVLVRDLKQQADQERLNEQIAKQNFADAKARYAEVQRIATQRKQTEGSAREQTRVDNARLDYSQDGRDYSAQQSRIKYARVRTSLLPGQEDMALQRLQDSTNRGYLQQSYSDAGITASTISATLKDGPRVKALVSEIKDLEASIISARAKGNIDLQKEATILEEIRGKMVSLDNARHDQNLNDPERVQARRDAQAKNMLSRASGEGGAALLAVQASLMANYSILTTTVGAMKAAISTSVELEAAFRNVEAVTGTSRSEMSGLETKIKDVAAASKFSSLEVADAALILGQAGLSAKQVGEALQPVVMLASAAGTSIAQAVDLVTSVIGVFDKGTSDIADIANKITQAANSSKVSVEKLAVGFQYAGNIAAQVGVSFEEVTAAMAAMSNAGIKNGSTMGTGLRQFFTEIEKPSKEFVESLQRIGLTISDIDLRSHGLLGVTSRLREAGFVASDAIKSFDVRSAAAFNSLIANPAELERQYRLLLDTKAGVQANEAQMDSLKAQSTRLTTSLGNLASAGFEPLSHLLSATLGGFASLTQAVSEHNVVVGVAGTALAALLATGASTFLANMAAGALKLASSAGEASVAVTALQTASKAGSLGTLLTSLGLIAPVATEAAVATGVLGGAMNGLKTAFLGLSVTTGIGIAIGLATASFYAFEYIVGRTAKEIDNLKAATNTAKGAFEEKDAAVKSLSQKIEDLNYKENSLRGNSESLKTESMALVSQFGAIGYQTDSNNVSFDTMISKLKALKLEMSEIRKQSLETSLASNRALLQKQVDKAQSDVKEFSGTNGWTKDYAREISNAVDIGGSRLSKSDREKLMAAQSQLQQGKLDNMGDVAGATLIVQKLSADLKASNGADSKSIARLDRLTDNMVKVGKVLTDVGTTRADIARQESQLNQDEAYKRYNTSGKFGTQNGKPISFEDSLPTVGNLEVMALKSGAKVDEKNPLAVYDAMKAEQETRAKVYKQRLEQIKQDEKAGDITADTASTFRSMVNARAEKEKNELLQMAKATDDEAGLNYDRQKRLLQSKKKNAKERKDKGAEADIEKQLADLEIEKANRDETSPTKALRTAESLKAIRDQNIQNIYDRQNRSGSHLNSNLSERSLRVQADAFDRQADELKSSTKTATSMEELSKLLDEAVDAKIEAKKKRIEALVLKQKAEAKQPGYDKSTGDLAHSLELKSMIDSEDSKINTFATSFVSLLEAAMARLDKVTKNINEQKRKIAEDKWQGEDRVFESQQALREVDLEIALGKKTKSKDLSTSVTYGKPMSEKEAITRFTSNGATVDIKGDGNGSSRSTSNLQEGGATASSVNRAIRETLTQRRNRLVVEAAKVELEENEKLLGEYGDDTSGLIGNLNEAYRTAKESVKTLREKLKTETDSVKRDALTAQLGVAEKQEGETFRDLRTAKGEQKQLRKDNFDIKKKSQENTEALPKELTMDNLLDKLDQVWDRYQKVVGDMDVVKTVGDGLAGVLGSTTGAIGNAFAAVLTGTKSIKSAFKDMAAGVVKSMIDILSQALAMQAMKGLFAMFGFSTTAASAGSAATMDAGITAMPVMAATGGYIIPGGIQRWKKMAGGGGVTGGIRGKDSVPTLLMPGEFVMRKSAVDTVGTDYLHSLNDAANTVASSSTSKAPTSSQPSAEGSTVNVWVVTPDQKPGTMGPKDVVAIVSDDISRGGSIKKLVKQIQGNQI